jgi:hypothetical protein
VDRHELDAYALLGHSHFSGKPTSMIGEIHSQALMNRHLSCSQALSGPGTELQLASLSRRLERRFLDRFWSIFGLRSSLLMTKHL